MMSSSDTARDKLLHDLNQVIRDAENLLRNSEQEAGEGYKSAKEKFEATLNTAKAEILRVEDAIVSRTKDAALATDEYVKQNPWQSAGVAAGIGLLVGLLISRR
jgi:ElaB/YqjD/DUF883 family membrane-anchored ribosome-binding protein